jgi:hypothetical protein
LGPGDPSLWGRETKIKSDGVEWLSDRAGERRDERGEWGGGAIIPRRWREREREREREINRERVRERDRTSEGRGGSEENHRARV